MKVLITGGSGFIGSHLADRLLARGDSICVIDNYATGRRDNLVSRPKLSVVEGDIADPELTNRAFADFAPDVVVHAAASYKDPNDWIGDARVNVVGTAAVVRAAQAAKVKRFVYFQTALCYGVKPLQQPIQLDHPILSGNSSYAISKTAGEQYVQLSGLDWVSFRLANAYGPRNISGPLPTFFKRLSDGKPCFVVDTRRDFVFVDDMIDCAEKACDGKGAGVYHLSSGGDVSIKELFDATIAAMRINLERPVEERPRNPDDAPSILLSPDRTAKDFGWSTKTKLKDGVLKAIEYYKTFGIEQTFTHLEQHKS
jgi:UDP-glucose 4-epimerase